LPLDYGQLGIALLIVSLVAIAVEGVVAAVWTVRLARRSQQVQVALMEEQGRIEVDVARLRLAMAETEVLWRPYGRLLRWLQHPLTLALMQSYARRRAAAR
jgi:hypothetical protein